MVMSLVFDSEVSCDGTWLVGELKPMGSKYDVFVFGGLRAGELDYTFEETVAKLVTLAVGYPLFETGDQYKTSFHLCGKYNGNVFTLYDWKGGDHIHIGGNNNLDVDGLITELKSLLDQTPPTSFTAYLNYEDCDGVEYRFPPAHIPPRQ